MKINIKHVWNTYNYGSCMMAISLINAINKNVKNSKFYVDCDSKEDLQRLRYETGINNIIRSKIDGSSNFFVKCFNKIRRFFLNIEVNKIKNTIVIGGDDISEYYGIQRLENELKNTKIESEKKNIILLGQTMGPFTGNRGELSRKCLSNTLIYTRDDKNYNYLKELKFSNVNKGRDLAFISLPMQNKAKAILKKYNLIDKKYMTLVASGLVDCYTKNREDYINCQVDLIRNILNKNKYTDFYLVLLVHVTRSKNNDDKVVIEDIIKKLTDKEINRIVVIKEEMMPSCAREILGNGILTITGRMHAAVSTLYMRKPAISLSYSVKYAGVIGQGLDLNELVIESADEELWASGKISALVDEKINYVLENYDKLIKKIDINVAKTTKIVEKELEDVVKQIKIN